MVLNWAAVLRHCQSGGQLQDCLRATVTLRPGPGPGLILPSQGPGNPSDLEGPCWRRHGQPRGAAGPAPGVRHQPAGGVHPNSVSNRLIPSTDSAMHQHWRCSGMNSRAVCMRFWVQIRPFSYFANSDILSYTAYIAVYTFSIYEYTSISWYVPVWDVFISMLCYNSVCVGIAEYIQVYTWYIMIYTSM